MTNALCPKINGDSSRDINQLLPTPRILMLAALYECKRRGIPIMLGEIWRSDAAQHRDFLLHRTKLDAGMSMHQKHIAGDTYTDPKRTGGKTYHRPTMQAAALVFKEYGMIWGGDWDNDGDLTDNKFDDWPHYQFCTIEEQKLIYKMKTQEEIEAWMKKKFVKQLERANRELKARKK